MRANDSTILFITLYFGLIKWDRIGHGSVFDIARFVSPMFKNIRLSSNRNYLVTFGMIS